MKKNDGVFCVESSAKTGLNVEEVFLKMIFCLDFYKGSSDLTEKVSNLRGV